jgi:putative transposase
MTTVRQFSHIALAMLTLTGRVTMLGISHWAGRGGSYRTVQRLFATVLPWASLFWLFFRTHLFQPDDVYLLGGDEVVVTKAGKHTHGLSRFFSSLYGKPIPGLAFFSLSLISTKARRSFPISVEQVVPSASEPAEEQANTRRQPATFKAPKRKPGRPKGRKNTDKTQVTLTPELQRIKTMIQALRERIGGWLPLTYLVLSGHFGNNNGSRWRGTAICS